MEINFFRSHITHDAASYRTFGSMRGALLNMLNKLNCYNSYTRTGSRIILDDGTVFNVQDIPRLNVESLDTATAKGNVMDFGSANYFKYTNSSGKSMAVFSRPGGALCRPISEDIDFTEYDKDTERYIHFWNILSGGHALMSSPNISPVYGYSDDQIRGYLDEANISTGFFSVKIGSSNQEFFYSATEQYPLYTKADYDLRYYTMTSSDFAYNKSVFKCLEPGTEIVVAGEKYSLKEDFTLDIPYGTDIFDIHIPKHTHKSKASASIDCRV